MKQDTKTIRISKEIYEQLVARASYQDTMTKVLEGLLNELKAIKSKQDDDIIIIGKKKIQKAAIIKVKKAMPKKKSRK